MILQGLKKFLKAYALQFGILLMATLWLVFIAVSWAEAARADELPANEAVRQAAGMAGDSPAKSDEYDFSWLDPEKKIYVLQNRRYLKANHIMLSAMIGSASSNPYRNALSFEGRATYFISETFGIEAFYTYLSNKENATFEALKQSSPNALPSVREIRSQYGLLAQWLPWYAKINVFNSILYFDWYFNAGAGQLGTARDTRTSTAAQPLYVNENLFGLFLGTGHLYHLSENYTVRLDVSGAFYKAPITGATGDGIWFSNYVFGIGLARRF